MPCTLTLFFSVYASLSMNSISELWLTMELGTVAFTGLMALSSTNLSEAIMVYFLVQSTSSALLLMAVTILLSVYPSFSELTVTFSVLVKLGLPPTHFWVLKVSRNMPWPLFLMLVTIQKILPLLIAITAKNSFLGNFTSVTALIGASLTLSSLEVKSILILSSSLNMAWLLSAWPHPFLIFAYFSIYSFSMMALVPLIVPSSTNLVLASSNLKLSSTMTIVGVVSILSMAAIPPFSGFFPKLLMVILNLKLGLLSVTLALCISSVIMLLAYFRMIFSFMFQGCHSSVPLLTSTSTLVSSMALIPVFVTPSFLLLLRFN